MGKRTKLGWKMTEFHTAQGESYYTPEEARRQFSDPSSAHLNWSLRFQRHHGQNERVIKELKFMLRKVEPSKKPEVRRTLKFAKDQTRLMHKVY